MRFFLSFLGKGSFFLLLLLFMGVGCFSSSAKSARDGGVYKSIDAAAQWTQTVAFPSAKGIGSLGAVDIVSMVMDPQDHKALYIGTKEDGLFFSYNGAQTWQRSEDENLQSGLIPSIAIDSKDVCTVYVVKSRYIYKSENCSRTFERVYDETRSEVIPKKVALDWYDPSIVYSGLSNGDVLKSRDYGKTWTKMFSSKEEITDLLVSKKDSRIILLGTGSEGIFYSKNGGETWQGGEALLEKSNKADMVYELTQSVAGDVILASTGYGLLRSTNQGEKWERVNLVTSAGQVRIRAITLVPDEPKTIYYATSSTLYKTVNGGETWDTHRLPSTRSASLFLIDPENTDVIYLGTQLLEEQKKGL